MIRAILRRKTKCQHSGMETDSLYSIVVECPELERALNQGGFGDGGYDMTSLVGVELEEDN